MNSPSSQRTISAYPLRLSSAKPTVSSPIPSYTMAAAMVSRSPLTDVSSTRMQGLDSAKNRQNCTLSSAPKPLQNPLTPCSIHPPKDQSPPQAGHSNPRLMQSQIRPEETHPPLHLQAQTPLRHHLPRLPPQARPRPRAHLRRRRPRI